MNYQTNFANIYDKLMWNSQAIIYKEILEEKILQNKNYKILDLWCWSWEFLALLWENFEKFGIDLSQDLLRIAKNKNKNSKFENQNIKNFKFNEKFDIIICSFDTINHILKFKNWQKIFENINFHLKNEWFFIFDYNTKEKFKNINNKTLTRKIENLEIIIKTNQNLQNKQIMDFDIKILEKNKIIHKEKIKEITFNNKTIEKFLKKNFKKVKIIQKFSDKNRIFMFCEN